MTLETKEVEVWQRCADAISRMGPGDQRHRNEAQADIGENCQQAYVDLLASREEDFINP